ncbi:DUF484 family protein [Oceanisphaera pacifica]|uniref:DUF484 family protein n=1 Tax=Oceanisphaera pacifica TaxID=2818389 RepID=A0ABS3NJ05_9GAMM|nr:DUF484 family protein [Oceanisphaera pacifica]MBO1520552.1 DUF484 family protein [Oceanisphaera pacifica]
MSEQASDISPNEAVALDDATIAEYLQDEPHFFARNPSLLRQLRLPHAQRGSLSLVEAKLEQQRLRIYELEDDITELMTVASDNERIFRVYMDLIPQLFKCTSVTELESYIRRTLQDKLRVPAVRLILDARTFVQADKTASEPLARLYQERMSSQMVYLGRLGKEEKRRLFQDSLVNSCALIRIGHHGEMGLLAFGSADGGHYGTGMDTLLINQLAEVLAQILPKLIAQEPSGD